MLCTAFLFSLAFYRTLGIERLSSTLKSCKQVPMWLLNYWVRSLDSGIFLLWYSCCIYLHDSVLYDWLVRKDARSGVEVLEPMAWPHRILLLVVSADIMIWVDALLSMEGLFWTSETWNSWPSVRESNDEFHSFVLIDSRSSVERRKLC